MSEQTKRVPCTVDELAELMRRSDHARRVHAVWGTGDLLIETEDDRWMLDELNKMRSGAER